MKTTKTKNSILFTITILLLSCNNSYEKESAQNQSAQKDSSSVTLNSDVNERQLTEGELKLLNSIQYYYSGRPGYMDIFENGFNCNFDNVKILSDLKSFSISVDLISCDKDGYGEVEFVDSWAQGSHTYLITRSPTGYKTIVESKQLNGGDGTVCNRSQIWEDDNMISEKKDKCW